MLSAARIASLVAFCLIAALQIFAVVERVHAGVPAVKLDYAGTAGSWQFRVAAAPPGSGLHAGDRVRIDDAAIRAALELNALPAGSTFPVRRTSPLPERTVDVPVGKQDTSTLRQLALGLELLFLGIAALVTYRGRASGSLALAWFFALMVTLFNPASPAWPRSALLIYSMSTAALAIVTSFCATVFVTRLGDSGAPWAERVRAVARVLAFLGITANLALSSATYFVPDTPGWAQWTAFGFLLAQPALFLVGIALAYANAAASDRQRVAWVVASLGTGIVGFIIAVVIGQAGVPEPARDAPLLLLLAMPIGCAYAILRYRLLDIGFVVNRATVFGITSLLVLAALALVDFGLQNWLGSWLVRTGLYVQLALALGLGIATRPLHARVDAFVDDLFFRRRHESERALRQFARDAAHIDDTGVLLRRTVQTVARAADLGCALFLMQPAGLIEVASSEEGGLPQAVERNDPAAVRLLATREPVDLHGVESALRGDFAFPMFARNRLLGVLVCGGKADGVAAYAPDELDAIANVATAVGVAVDLLRIESLECELASLRRNARLPAIESPSKTP